MVTFQLYWCRKTSGALPEPPMFLKTIGGNNTSNIYQSSNEGDMINSTERHRGNQKISGCIKTNIITIVYYHDTVHIDSICYFIDGNKFYSSKLKIINIL
jgi:hypothetical protein